jgi:phenylpropionate dioxygenase-like ring-hydroxylating dioxygenase large terminal subunit
VLDLQHHLGPLDAELAAWGCHYEVAATMELELGSNWKSVLEAFQETYHFPYVHRDSLVGQGTISNIVTFDQFGRHHRLGVPLLTIGTSAEPVEGENVTCIYDIYPCSVLATSPLGGEPFLFLPGRNPASSVVRHTVLSRFPVTDEEVATFFKEYTPRSRPSSATRTASSWSARARGSPRATPTSCSAATRSAARPFTISSSPTWPTTGAQLPRRSASPSAPAGR